MPLDRGWLLGTARHERDALGRTIQYTPPDRWEAEAPGDRWRARDVLAHLAATEVAASSAVTGEIPPEFEEWMKEAGVRQFSIHGFNEWSIAKRRESSVISLAVEWGRAADLELARASKLTEEEWNTLRVQWAEEDFPVPFLIQSRICEWWAHGEDVRAAVGLPARIEHAPIFSVNDLAIRMIPYALGLAGLSFPGRSIHVELDGAGGGTWHYGLAPRERPAKDKRPDAFIEGRATAFALVAERRLDPEDYLYDGVLVLGGDARLARTVLEHVRAFA